MQGANTRLTSLDFIRGIAVLGLLLMNAPYMPMPEFGYLPFTPNVESDHVIRSLNAFLFDGRFRSLFCLLFGIGLVLQAESYRNKGLEPSPILKSRLNWLLVFGLIHCVFIWPGDILITYALSGRVMLLHIDKSSDELIKKGKVWFAIGIILFAAITAIISMNEGTVYRDSDEFAEAVALVTQGYFSDIAFNATMAAGLIILFPALIMFSLCGVMYLGIGLFKSGQLKTGFKPGTIKQLVIATVIISTIDAYIANFHLDIWHNMAHVLGTASGLSMALLIWHFVVVSKVHGKINFLAEALRRVGTMAFTFYIFQSLLLTFLFQVVFQQWIETFSLIDYFGLSVVVISLQLVTGYVYKS